MGYQSHLSLFFVIMRGECDPLLKWPFEYKVSMILVGKFMCVNCRPFDDVVVLLKLREGIDDSY